MGVESEPVRLVDLLREPCECTVRDVDHRVAAMAHEMGMTAFTEVVEGRPVARVHVLDDPDLAEPLQHSVDSRWGDPLLAAADCGDEVVSGEMGVGLEKHADDEPRRRGDAPAALPDDVVDRSLTRSAA